MARQKVKDADKAIFFIILPILIILVEKLIFYILEEPTIIGIEYKLTCTLVASLLLYLLFTLIKIEKLFVYSFIPVLTYFEGKFLLALWGAIIYPMIGGEKIYYGLDISITGFIIVFVLFGLIPYWIVRKIGQDEA